MSNLDDPIFEEEWFGDLQHTRFMTIESMAEYFLTAVAGLDVSNPQEANTPKRFVKALRELTTPDNSWEFTTFEAEAHDMVIIRDIQFASLCRHHVLPFFGTCQIGYIPNKRIGGLSKFPRFVKQCAAGLRTQEELTHSVADGLYSALLPQGLAVVMEAEHTCMTIRGAQAPGTFTYTAAMLGVFEHHEKTAKAEFLSRIGSR